MPLDLDQRSRDILHSIVEEYLLTGLPVGSNTLSRRLGKSISAATIRTVMTELSDEHLIVQPHTSAGRQPTQQGLRFYVDALMQKGELSPTDRMHIETKFQTPDMQLRRVYENASSILSGLSSCVGIVMAPKVHKPISQIQFLRMEERKVIAVIVTSDGMVENRLIDMPVPVTPDMLTQASNYLNSRIAGRTVGEIRSIVEADIGQNQNQLQPLVRDLVDKGVILPMSSLDDDYIFVSGQAHLLSDENTTGGLDQIRELLGALEVHKNMLDILDAVRDGDGVQIFIGSENRILSNAGWSTVIRPTRDESGRIIGATGVIGPMRLNYQRIVPIVNHTAQVMEKLLGKVSLDKI